MLAGCLHNVRRNIAEIPEPVLRDDLALARGQPPRRVVQHQRTDTLADLLGNGWDKSVIEKRLGFLEPGANI